MDRMGMPSYEGLDDQKGVAVRSVTLPSILKGLRRVAIKMDIEGGEHKIFEGGVDLSGVYALQMEYHNGLGRLVDTLRQKGFRVTHSADAEDTKKGIYLRNQD